MVGGEQHITSLLKPGDEVKPGDVVVQLNTSEQEFKLKEAESDLAEADQHLLQAKAQMRPIQKKTPMHSQKPSQT